MPWAVQVGASVLGGVLSSNAASDAADQQAQSAANGQALQKQEYDQTRSDLQPYASFGTNAIGSLNALNQGNYSGFLNSPDYLGAQQSGTNAINQSAASHGNLFTGGNEKDLLQFGQQNASQYLGNYRNSLMGQVGVGESAAASQGQAGQNYANQSGYLGQQAGQAQAQGTLGQASVWNNALNQGFNAFGSAYGSGGSGFQMPGGYGSQGAY